MSNPLERRLAAEAILDDELKRYRRIEEAAREMLRSHDAEVIAPPFTQHLRSVAIKRAAIALRSALDSQGVTG
jgi:hypothetical protein